MSVCEPAPLGLIGLAIAALVLGVQDMGWLNASLDKSMMIPWTLCLGATAQLIAGIMDFKRKNIFGATAFTTYSMLWYSVTITLVISTFTANFNLEHYAIGLIGFLIFSLILTVATLLLNKTLFGILLFIDLAIIALVLHILIDTEAILVGIPLLVVSALSFYGAAGGLLNTMTGKALIPMGKAIWTPK